MVNSSLLVFHHFHLFFDLRQRSNFEEFHCHNEVFKTQHVENKNVVSLMNFRTDCF